MKTIDLFSGCGGMSKGFSNAGFDILAAFEYWKPAVDCYKLNFDHPIYVEDLSQPENAISIIKKLNPEIIIGGPPCQDFSGAGKRIEGKNANLTEIFAKIISETSPKYFIMENVARARTSKSYLNARKLFKEAGYGLTEEVIDSSLCGVPQKRQRFFCIGIKDLEDNFVKDVLFESLDENPMTLRDYFGDGLGFDHYYRHPRNYNRRGIFSVDEPSPTIRGVNRPIPEGYTGHHNDSQELNDTMRAMTSLERALVQTFPSDFKWVGSKTTMEQLVGNAVPVNMANFVAKAVLKAQEKMNLNSTIISEIDDNFKPWLSNNRGYSPRTTNDIVSRIKRANKIEKIEKFGDKLYLFKLQQNPKYEILSTSVKSQLKRSIALLEEYMVVLE